jgi:hypothetical protein
MTSNSPPLEADIENECVLIAHDEGCRNVKLDKIERSLPDQEFFLPLGQTLLVEFKRPGEKPRPQQLARFQELADLGHPVSVIDSVPDFRRLLREALELAQSVHR